MAGFFRRISSRFSGIGNWFKRKPKNPAQPHPQSPTPKPARPVSLKPQYDPRLAKVRVDALSTTLSEKDKKPLTERQIAAILAQEEKHTHSKPPAEHAHSGLPDVIEKILQIRGLTDYHTGWNASTNLKKVFNESGEKLGFSVIEQMFHHYERVLFSPSDPRHAFAKKFVEDELEKVPTVEKTTPSTFKKGRIVGRLVAVLAREDLRQKQKGGN